MLASSSHSAVNWFHDSHEEVLCEYGLLLNQISLYNPKLAWSLRSGMVHGRLVGKLLCTVKTHKDEGRVVFGGIHNCSNSCFQPAMLLIRDRLRAKLRTQEHLIHDSFDLCRNLSALRVPGDAVMMQLDVKDFFYVWHTS